MKLRRPLAEPTAVEVPLLGRIDGCTNPESAEMLPDGETIVFGNCTIVLGIADYRGGRGITYARGEAHISRARLCPGEIVVEERRLLEGLTATHGVDVLSVATRLLPAGTAIITNEGGPQTYRDSGAILQKDAYQSNLLAFDPSTGEVLGAIPLGTGSAVALRWRDLEQPNGLAIADNGDIFVSDMAPGAEVPGWTSVSPSAIYRIPHAAIDRLIAGDANSADAVERIVTPGKTNGLTISRLDGSLLSVSCSPDDPVAGGVFRYTAGDFRHGRQPAPELGGLGIIDGLAETRRGTLIVSTPVSGEIHLFPLDGRHLVVRVAGERVVRLPADINVCYPRMLDGEPALLVPDISVGRPVGDGSVALLDLSGF